MQPRDYVDLVLLFLLLLGLGTTIELSQLKQRCLTKPAALLIGMVGQFVFLPPVAYGVTQMLSLEPGFAAGLVIMCCCPGGAMSNILCWLVQADVTLSVAMTAASSLVACGMLPLNLLIYVERTNLAPSADLDFLNIALTAMIVVAGTACGLLIARCGRFACLEHTAPRARCRHASRPLRPSAPVGAVPQRRGAAERAPPLLWQAGQRAPAHRSGSASASLTVMTARPARTFAADSRALRLRPGGGRVGGGGAGGDEPRVQRDEQGTSPRYDRTLCPGPAVARETLG